MDKFDLKSINSMDGHEFEELIGNLFSKMNFRIEQTKKTADGGIDILAYNEEPVVGGRYIIQCKRSSSPISESVIRDLYGVVTSERANKGILVTNSKFSPSSIKFSENKPIELIDGDKLINLLIKHFDIDKKMHEYKMPAHQELLYRAITRNIAGIQKKYNEIKNGLVYKNQKYIRNGYAYNKYFSSKNSDLQQFIEVLNNLIASFNEFPPEDTSDISQFIKPKLDNFNRLLIGLFNNWQDMFFTNCPEGFEKIHDTMMKIYDSIFKSLSSWMATLKSALNDPKGFVESNPQATLAVVLEEQLINEYCKEITSEFQQIQSNIEKSNKSSGCFIATACYGINSPEVTLLRQFRDSCLLKNKLGELFVQFYYKISPSIANIIKNNNVFKRMSSLLLLFVLKYAKKKL